MRVDVKFSLMRACAASLIAGLCLVTEFICLAAPPTVQPSKAPPLLTADKPPAKIVPIPRLNEAMRKKLQVRTSLEFVETPLCDVVEYLKTNYGIEIELDAQSLESAGIGTDHPITMILPDVSLDFAIRQLLRSPGLVAMIQDDTLRITTREYLETNLETHAFAVRDLIQVKTSEGNISEDPSQLLELIKQATQPNTWDDVGGPGNMACYDGMLMVTQTEEVLYEIDAILTLLRRLPKFGEPAFSQPPKVLSLSALHSQKLKVTTALEQPIELSFNKTPLYDTAQYIFAKCGVPVLLDVRALEDNGVGTDAPVTFENRTRPLRAALNSMLNSLELEFVVLDEAILIATEDEQKEYIDVVAYPVFDLLHLPPDPNQEDVQEELRLLGELLKEMVEVNSWEQQGGTGTMLPYAQRGILLVRHSQSIHTKLHNAIAQLRASQHQQPKSGVVKGHAENVVVTISYHFLDPTKPLPTELSQTITALIFPESWKEQKQAYIQALPHGVIVRQEKRVHRKIEILLRQLGLPYTGTLEGRHRRNPCFY